MSNISTNFSFRSLQVPEHGTSDPPSTASPLDGVQPPEEWWPEVDRVLSFIRPALAPLPGGAVAPALLHSNTHESFRAAVHEKHEAKAFKDWFHGFATTLSLLGSRASGSPEFLRSAGSYRKLLKAELMRGQLQATYSRSDSDRLNRMQSPLVREGYGRAVRTGLWMAAAAVRTEQLFGLLKENNAQLEGFAVCPVSRAFEYEGLVLTKLPEKDQAEINLDGLESVYIPSLRVQLIAKAKMSAVEMDGHFGRHGLRASPSECADICAESMVRKIGIGDMAGALKCLETAFDGEAARAVKNALAVTELQPNTLIVPAGIDPLTSSTLQQKQQLREIYEQCINIGSENLPFHVRQNIQVMQKLVGDLTEFLAPDMPAMICGDLTDALGTIFELRAQARSMPNPDTHPEAWSLHMERFYQAMQEIHRVIRFQNDWAQREFSLQKAIASLLSGPVEEGNVGLSNADAQALLPYATVERAPHALAMLEQIRASLPENISVAYLAGGYYETPGLFSAPFQCGFVTHPELPEKDLVIMEPHPNNAAEISVQAHDPVVLINHLFSNNPSRARTLVMDVTLNHLCDDQLLQTLKTARPHIESGMLNLVLLQSGTKFIQNGMDLANIGIAVVFNNPQCWGDFEANMVRNRMHVPADDEGYIASLLSPQNKGPSMAYLAQVRNNTAALRAMLEVEIPWDHRNTNAYEMCANSDEKTVYIALRPTDVYLAEKLGKHPHAEITPDERSAANIQLYKTRFRPAFSNLAAVDRSSFGFNITNFGECGETIRITLGIEELPLLREYARRILRFGASLYAEAFEAR